MTISHKRRNLRLPSECLQHPWRYPSPRIVTFICLAGNTGYNLVVLILQDGIGITDTLVHQIESIQDLRGNVQRKRCKAPGT